MKPSTSPSHMETRILTAAELTVWLAGAQAGDRLVYCTGPAMLAGPTQDRLAKLIAEGKVRAHKRRNPAGGVLEHYLVVLPPPRAAVEVTVSARPDLAAEAILRALERCVNQRRRAYSDFELAKIAGLATRNQAAWRVKKLAEAGAISIETVEGPTRAPWRVVIINGRGTMPPPREVSHD